MTREELKETFIQHGMLHLNGKLNASFIKKVRNNLEWQRSLAELFPGSISESLYLLQGKPVTRCEICGKPTSFRSFSEGYNRFCSATCRKISSALHKAPAPGAANPETLAKMRATCKARFGVENRFSLPVQRSTPNPEKYRQTCLERYGVDHPMKLEEIQRKAKETNIERYGVECSLQSERARLAAKETSLSKYGVENYQQSPIIVEKIRKSRWKNTYLRIIHSPRFAEKVIPLFDIDSYEGQESPMKYRCVSCKKEFEASFEDGKVPRCPSCYPVKASTSKEEAEIAEFVQSLLPLETVIRNDRVILEGLELDIFIPSKKIAIEYNGLYWHSELQLGNRKLLHLRKTELCEGKGIRLLHIFNDEWHDSPDLVKSVISAALGSLSESYGARQFQVVKVFGKELTSFYEENHLQGACKASCHYALMKDQQIFAAISFSRPRFSKKAEWEIARYAVKKHCKVAGGFSRLMKAFIEEYNPKTIITYADRRIFTGKMYETFGFTLIENTAPGYWYTKDYQSRENRMKYQKHTLPDQSLTEWENMQLLGYDRIWDSGQRVFLFTF